MKNQCLLRCCVLSILALFIILPAAAFAGEEAAKPRKVGLALSGGGARGAAHIGVLKVLERERIPIDFIAGTSFGSLVGGLHALGYSASEIERIFSNQDWNTFFSDSPDRRLSSLVERRELRYQGQLTFRGLSPELPTGLLGGQNLITVLNKLTMQGMLDAAYDFDKLPIPFRAVATDLVTGEAHVFKSGRMTEALRASVAIPMLFTPVEKGPMLLVDGGLVNNLPTDIVRDMGADIIIAVDVMSPLLTKDEIKNFLNVVDQTISFLMKISVDKNQQIADLTFRPDLEGYTYSDYGLMTEIVKRGEEEAEKRVGELRALAGGLPPRDIAPSPGRPAKPLIESIAFEGLKNIGPSQLRREVRVRRGEPLNLNTLQNDLRRLYATRLFDRVDADLEPAGQDRYRLKYLLREASSNTLGASIRYDNDYKFVTLAEFTTRQLFNTPSVATITSRFGGLEDHSASLRYIPSSLPFFFVEPKVHLRRTERLDIRENDQVDQYTDKRFGGQVMLGGSFLKRLEIEMGYRADRVTVNGGTEPNRQEGALRLAGLTGRLNRDSLDAQNFPRAGMLARFQVDKRSKSLGSDLSYWKWQGDVRRVTALSQKSVLAIGAAGGYSRGPIPFFDRFYVGGTNQLEGSSRHFHGFTRDELLARQMALFSAHYRYRVFSQPLSFVKRGFLNLHYNFAAFSDRDASPFHFQYFSGIGLGMSLDTLLGPIRLGGGWGEGGRGRFYFSFGPSF